MTASDPGPAAAPPRRLGVLAAAMFLSSFAWSFVFVSLPFHIQAISPLDPAATLRWTGWLLGVTSLVTVATAPVWGRVAARGSAKRCYLLVEVLQAVGFLGMALARDLRELFAARFALGLTGASSTIAFMLAGRSGDEAAVRRGVAAVQSAMTVGQMLGPLAGALTAARIGFRPSFLVGGLILLACAGLVQLAVRVPPEAATGPPRGGGVRPREVAAAATIVLVGSTQLFFLTAILPQVLPDLGVAAGRTVEVGGLVVFVSGLAAALGALAVPRLVRLLAEPRLVATLLVASSACLLGLALPTTAGGYAGVRFLQVLCVAPVFPLVVAGIAQRGGGGTIGVVNSARMGAAFVGPVLATSVLSWGPPVALYATLALLGVACVPLVLVPGRPAAGA
jgi:DHA1 family multidrug resistance protein-like MFS transporter